MKPPAPMDDDGDQVLESTHAETALSTHAEASKMLEAALQQMDGIIAGSAMCTKMFYPMVNYNGLNPGTQQELRKLSVSESHTTPKSIQDALDQLQDTVEILGVDKRQVCKWVSNAFGGVRQLPCIFPKPTSYVSEMKQ